MATVLEHDLLRVGYAGVQPVGGLGDGCDPVVPASDHQGRSDDLVQPGKHVELGQALDEAPVEPGGAVADPRVDLRP